MNERKAIIFAVRVVGLSVINFLVWMVVSSAVSGALDISVHPEIEQSMTAVMLLMLATSFCNTAVLCYAVVRSKFSRLKLVVIVFLVYFGINTFISQIETIYFNESLNIPGMEIFSFFLTGFITALIFSPLAVLIMGKFRRGGRSRSGRGDCRRMLEVRSEGPRSSPRLCILCCTSGSDTSYSGSFPQHERCIPDQQRSFRSSSIWRVHYRTIHGSIPGRFFAAYYGSCWHCR